MLSPAEKRKQLQERLRAAESAPATVSQPVAAPSADAPASPGSPVAIIGLAGRYPGADTLDAFWANLIAGKNCIEEIQGERAEDYRAIHSKTRIKHFGLLQDIYRFDAQFFNISRREAEVMDPHMRLLLETAWSCIENAGYKPRALDPHTGVFTSFYNHEYSELLAQKEVDESSAHYVATGTTGAIYANRISFLLGLTGPSEVYDTACSTALVALHRAIQAIAAGECHQAIVAGVSLLLTPARVEALDNLGILNKKGVCNPYSYPANGEVLGEGVGALLIKPLDRALADHDYIYAVIRGTGVNHHGDRSGRLTFPSAEALSDLMATTYATHAIDPHNLCYVEGHGAGGEADVVELRALQRFLEGKRLSNARVGVGSVKGNIGFGEASGGMAQLTKSALALHHRQIPATLNFERVDPVFDLDHSPLHVQSQNVGLSSSDADSCISILAYGLGGSNAHVVMAGHKSAPFDVPEDPLPLLLSAGSEEALAEYVRQLSEHLAQPSTRSRYKEICGSPGAVLHCIAQTLIGRERHASHRVAFIAETLDAVQACCADFLAGVQNARVIRKAVADNSPPVQRWVHGDDAAVESLINSRPYQKLPLPGVPFKGEIYRLKPKSQPITNRPALESRWQVTRTESGFRVEVLLTLEDCFIVDHVVAGVATLPGVACIVLMRKIAQGLYQNKTCTIENLAWTLPFELTGKSATAKIEIADSGAFRIYHKESGRLCCKGRLVLHTTAKNEPPRVAVERLTENKPFVDRNRYWELANAPETRQFHSEALRRLLAIHAVDDQVIGVLDPVDPELADGEIALLDSALGTCRGFAIRDSKPLEAVVPFAIERVSLYSPLPAGKALYVAARERGDALGRFDISIEDGRGTVFGVIQGYYAKLLDSPALPEKEAERPAAKALSDSSVATILAELRQRVAEFLKCDLALVPVDSSLAPLGLDSVGIHALTDQLSRRLNFDLPATLFFEHANLRDLAEHLVRMFPDTTVRLDRAIETERNDQSPDAACDIAVVGIGGLFPGARNAHELWTKLMDGEDLITEMPEARRESIYRVYADSLRELKGLYGGFIQDADRFDGAFFGYSDEEVMAMDPQQRLFLEAGWAAIEDAGYFPPSFSGRRVGVYVGAIVNDYSSYLRDIQYPVSRFHEGTGSSLAGIANRLSYTLNLTGPSMAVDTACSSSLYAIDRAVSDLRSGACESAIAGGVSFVCTANGYEMYRAMNYLAKDWHCKAFAEGGDGWSKAEIFAAVYLKRYEDAVRDGDSIYAVIKATGTNHGGKGYFYTQPNSARHVELIRDVYRKAKVDSRSVVYIEAHGSGTGMGDALEFNSIARALREQAQELGVTLTNGQCGIGSIKSNFGHAEAGSGIAGFIKTALALHHGVLPPTLHLNTINKHIRQEQSPLFLVEKYMPLPAGQGSLPRCAGVHSFNFSGATAHALLAEDLTQTPEGCLGISRYPICLSAKTSKALASYCRDLARFLKSVPELAQMPGVLDRLTFTINSSRSYFPFRRGIIAESLADLIAKLEADFEPMQASPSPVRENTDAHQPLSDENVATLVNCWLSDSAFDWTALLKPCVVAKLHLPTYPFEHERSYFPVAGVMARVGPVEAKAIPVRPEPAISTPAPSGNVEGRLTAILSSILAIPAASIDLGKGVGEFGFDSLKVTALAEALNEQFGVNITPPELFGFSTPREIAKFISAASPATGKALLPSKDRSVNDAVAIVGMSGQFPGAPDLDTFWRNLVGGKDAITEIPPDRWDWRAIHGNPRTDDNKTNVRWGGFIDDVTSFDPIFFRISPREAELMDPQQRLLMMYVWRAIEDAGYRPSSLAGSNTGLFVGTAGTQYGARMQVAGAKTEGFGATGAIPSIGPNRMSHFLDLHGPSEPVETSCSSSLVAIHRAVLAIRAGECDLAIAGGINTIVTPDEHIAFSRAGMLCEDGRCKTFSADANGYVRGEGVGMLVLKPLAAAESDGDHIYGVIRGSAVNHGGRANSLTAPNPKAQAELLRTAYSKAGIDPRTVGYIEAHGTGTPLGDPIEINALKSAFQSLYEATGNSRVDEPHCGLASVKTNIGHLELAAGVAGVIKVLLQMRHGVLVKSLHCKQVNPYIQLEGTPFYLLTENRPWLKSVGFDGKPQPRRAGVSSFGFGGVNAHVIIEEYVPRNASVSHSAEPATPQLVVLSARNNERLNQAIEDLHRYVDEHPETSLEDLAYTLQTGREEMEARFAVVAASMGELREKLNAIANGASTVSGTFRGIVGAGRSLHDVTGSDVNCVRLAEHWVTGGTVDWEKHRSGKKPRRISLPTYPFARERFWWKTPGATLSSIPANDANDTLFAPRWQATGPCLNHPLERCPRTVVLAYRGSDSELPGTFAENFQSRGFRVIQVLLGGETYSSGLDQWFCGRDDAKGFETCLANNGPIDCVVFLSDSDSFESQRAGEGAVQLLRLAKTIEGRLSDQDTCDFFVVSRDTFRVTDFDVNPASGGLTGLAYSLAQGDHRLRLRNIDISWEDTIDSNPRRDLVAAVLSEPATHRGEAIKLFMGQRYRQVLLRFDVAGEREGFRRDGVYVILGGAGHVGDLVTRRLIQEFHAHVIWLGRKSVEHPDVRARLESYRNTESCPSYIRADALDVQSLRQAIASIRKEHGEIHGAIFAGNIFNFDNRVCETSEAEFTRILEVKTRGSVNFYEAFKDQKLDFLCYFSSAQAYSFSGAATLSAYAAGITFADAFARSIRATSPFPVGTVNWGFWETNNRGPAALEHAGFLDAKTGTDAFKQFIGLLRTSQLHEMLCLHATKAVADLMPIDADRLVLAQSSAPVKPQELDSAEREPLTAPAAACDFEKWMLKLLAVQIKQFSPGGRDEHKLIPELRRWVQESLRFIDAAARESGNDTDDAQAWAEWDQHKPALEQEPCLRAKIALAEACLRQLPRILSGESAASGILFPGGSMELVERVYAEDRQFAYFSKIVSATVRARLEQSRSADPRFQARILEIGAGTGGTTRAVLDGLGHCEEAVAEYCYTDLSQAFLAHGRKRFGDHRPYLKFEPLDIEQPISTEKPHFGRYDVVVAANVLHATRDIRKTIRHAKALLKRNGCLILDEIAGPSLFAHLTFGLLPGWWLFENSSLRISGSPGLYPETWERLLKEEGFSSVSFPASEAHQFSQQVIIAVSDGLVRVEKSETRVENRSQETVEKSEACKISDGIGGVSLDVFRQRVLRLLAEFLKIPVQQIGTDNSFADYGVDSILGISFVEQVGKELGVSLNSAILFDHATVNRLSAFLLKTYGNKLKEPATECQTQTCASSCRAPLCRRIDNVAPVNAPDFEDAALHQTSSASETDEIAVIGMSGQFPGAEDVEAFWRNLLEGRDCVEELPSSYLGQEVGARIPSRRGGILKGRASFDPFFFNILPREAEAMNPHQRLILQESWKALEDAAINPRSLAGQRVGLFIGAEPSGYEHDSFTGASDALIASRLSYFLDLKGPSLVVNTGCSSSATAIHLACESLKNGESRVALAGGVFAVLGERLLERLAQMDLLSPTGCCHAFDAAADGTVFSEGVGVVVLKRLSDALADGDPIYAVIQASGLNQDGASNGITAPNGDAQEALLAEVYRRHAINPEKIQYIEAHGTGTRLGDPVEANALVRAFKQFTKAEHFCAVGAAKASIGHTSAAAGVIGLIKLLLMLRHGKIPATRGVTTLNPLIQFEGSAFYVNKQAVDWPRVEGTPRMAALSSFGHSGTNVHLVVRSQDEPKRSAPPVGSQIVVISAKEEARLKESAIRLADFIERNPEICLADLAYTLQVGREAMTERLALVVADANELSAKLRSWATGAKQISNCWRGCVNPQRPAPQANEPSPAQVAELWTLGADIDWKRLHQGREPRRLRLPTYPFAREHYWAEHAIDKRTTPAPAMANPQAQQDGIGYFEEVWQPMTHDSAAAPSISVIKTLLCFLSEPQNQEALRAAVHARDPQVRVFFVSQADTGPDFKGESLRNTLNELETVDALWYFWPVEDQALRSDLASPLGLVQALASARLNPKTLVLAGTFEDGLQRAHLESWVGMERSLGLVFPGLRVGVLLQQAQASENPMGTLADRAWRWSGTGPSSSILYLNGVAHELRAKPVQLEDTPSMNLDGKTILIPGACGGLGVQVARRLVSKWKVNLVLTGRSPVSEALESILRELRSNGAGVLYYQADICDAAAMESVLHQVREKFGPIHGLIHAAGIKDSRTILDKSLNEARAVLRPKVEGTLVLDQLLAADPLEFVCYFSSSSASLGDFGACDYAMANRFQMAYADFRNTLVAAGKAKGRTRAICWTVWKEVGMGRGVERDAAFFLKSSGQRALEATEGLEIFERLLPQSKSQHIVLAGQTVQMERAFARSLVPATEAPGKTDQPSTPQALECDLIADLKEQLHQLFKIPPARIGHSQNFADFGIDSIGLAELAQHLSSHYQIQFTPSVFFGHSTLESLAAYLAKKGVSVPADSDEATSGNKAEAASEIVASSDKPPVAGGPIAVIGMSGRFAGARNIDEMWRILAEGRSAVAEMPAERFQGQSLAFKPHCGCLPGVAEFDPLFFEISPAEAEEMDPRQRLLLQETWNALEDAGIGPADLKTQRVGMFVGVEEGDYPGRSISASITANHTGILAARLAYFLNLRGPVLAINTSCSSSLVAVHQACQSLSARECEVAVVGGVSLILSQASLAAMSEAGMLSPYGICHAFDRQANGMVPGEAAVAVVLKPLDRALADGDPVHAVLLGSGINYDGKTNGITAPNGVAQAELIQSVMQRAGIAPGQVQHIVTHGTGTRLGDPVEVNALKEAYGESSVAHCALTSCKPNFGHAFAASGLVSLIALVQSMRKEIIPPSLHFKDRNEFIEWEKSPFFVNVTAKPWPTDPQRERIGAVSAFGMSGTNAHIILRDFIAPHREKTPASGPWILAFSAKTREALQERIQQFTQAVESGEFTDAQLPQISHTLLCGRHPFAHRHAVVAESLATAVKALQSAAPTSSDTPLFQRAAEWCRGRDVDWTQLLDPATTRRLHLPTYPFARREFWLPHRTNETQDHPRDRLAANLVGSTLCKLGLLEADPHLPGYLDRWLAETRTLLAESAWDRTKSLDQAWADWTSAPPSPERTLMETCLRSLPAILRGERKPVDVLFPDASLKLVEPVYRQNALNQVLAQAAATWVGQRLSNLKGPNIRILEIGAGTGATTSVILSQFAPFKAHIEEYCYTDISKAFLLHAEDCFVPEHPYVAPRLFDVSRPAKDQGIAERSYDIVIAANVLHAAANIREAIQNAASLLRPGGLLLLNELSANGWFTHLTFGLLEGWWLFQDGTLRLRGCPAVAPETWKRLLRESGFASVEFPASSGHVLGQQVIAAELPDACPQAQPGVGGNLPLRKDAIRYFKELVGTALKLQPDEIDSETLLETYGLDSLMIGRVLGKLRTVFKEVPSTLMFEIQTISALADYFLAHHKSELVEKLGVRPVTPSTATTSSAPVVTVERQSPVVEASREPIAIIGMSGHFPSAPDLHAFWENLKTGKDCITEIPSDRWPMEGFFDPDVEQAIDTGKSYCKWGGFLDGFSNFDPLFFNLSPASALETDPQERIFVQAAWEAMEDAGYTRKALAEKYDGCVGVYAGIAHAEFNVLGPDQWRQGKWVYPRTSFGSVANRVSFLFNLNGPSIPVDTMCSSALTAIHEACESILRGECPVAIAGAVNLCLHSSVYVSLCASRLLSKGAKCHSFGVGDDGYVPGEGVGVVMLKRLSAAKKDGDRIHAIIRGTAVNHGGRTNGYTVPNPNAQARVIRRALDKAGVDARQVSYIEAHGAGTKLGDPIEVLGLTRAFRQDTPDSGYCSLGSVKSNVGHLEAAAGMAGLAKVILQMQHKQLVPSLHSAVLNPEIRFEETPFVVQQELRDWKTPAGNTSRIAGISAFGAGGSNAHVIIEEYEDHRPAYCGEGPYLVVLSARNQERLMETARNFRRCIEANPDLCLADVAYTLQIGREAMEERMGCVAASLKELSERLAAYVEGKSETFARGSARASRAGGEQFLDDADLAGLVHKWIDSREHAKILEAWVRGYAVDWSRLYPAGTPRRIELPTYPFERESYWLPEQTYVSGADQQSRDLKGSDSPARPWLHFCEAWESRPLPENPNLRERLAQFAGKTVAIVAADRAEAGCLEVYLRQLESDYGIAPPLRIHVVALEVDAKVEEAPEVVLFLGPRLQTRSSGEPSEADVAGVFNLSRRLMNRAWGDSIEIYYLYEAADTAPRVDFEALSGFLRAAQKENEQHVWTLIGDYNRETEIDRAQLLVREWLLGTGGREVRYDAGNRKIRKLAEIELKSAKGSPLRQNGVYLLAGGLGYLGRELSWELARRYKATLVLLTRGALDESRKAHCRELEALGAKVVCESVDIADRQQLEQVYQAISRRVGPIRGVFHLARHHEDELIARKSWDSFQRVIRPKVHGALYLDELTRNEPLDFFVLFSSLGAYGVRGSSDYSYATSFENAFSELRNRWVELGLRSGPTTSICWGPWLEDHLFPQSRAKLAQAGFRLIDVDSGFSQLEAALSGGISPLGIVGVRDETKVRQIIGFAGASSGAGLDDGYARLLDDWENRRFRGEDVSERIAGRIASDELDRMADTDVNRLYRLLFDGEESPVQASPAQVREDAFLVSKCDSGIDEVTSIIRNSVANVLHLSDIDNARSFLDYGLDSIAGMKLAVRLERQLKREVPPQWLVTYPTVAALAKQVISSTPST